VAATEVIFSGAVLPFSPKWRRSERGGARPFHPHLTALNSSRHSCLDRRHSMYRTRIFSRPITAYYPDVCGGNRRRSPRLPLNPDLHFAGCNKSTNVTFESGKLLSIYINGPHLTSRCDQFCKPLCIIAPCGSTNYHVQKIPQHIAICAGCNT